MTHFEFLKALKWTDNEGFNHHFYKKTKSS